MKQWGDRISDTNKLSLEEKQNVEMIKEPVKGTKMVSEQSVLRVYRARRRRKDDGVAWAGKN